MRSNEHIHKLKLTWQRAKYTNLYVLNQTLSNLLLRFFFLHDRGMLFFQYVPYCLMYELDHVCYIS